MSVRYIFDLFADIRYSWVLRFLPENQCAERERGHFEFSTMFILYLCTQLGNEFLVTFYTPRNSNASVMRILVLATKVITYVRCIQFHFAFGIDIYLVGKMCNPHPR